MKNNEGHLLDKEEIVDINDENKNKTGKTVL